MVVVTAVVRVEVPIVVGLLYLSVFFGGAGAGASGIGGIEVVVVVIVGYFC